ncbi:phenylacetic acid degradation operon negative regulatory protein PaaX [Caldalkalibacillus salinus]|uniref:phenylacetic acid degradation operon negative regulatory protein PaaX n=1 Tax=Caldalkalibacillus salinus TaxID=2803787 RepID=UPI001923893C|nr:phenylacetic acid degradation operon negative regulatory protein PaaX [Caldalkalibacillus salinus]
MNTRSMIFTLYGDYIHHYGGEIWIGSLIRLLEEFGHNAQAIRAAISRMSKQGWVEANKVGNKSYYSLTPQGQKRIEEAATRIFKLKSSKWDGQWRMLIYSIPEEKRNLRDELRKELTWSGFGSLTFSCYISPNPLEEQVQALVKRYDIEPYVDFFTSDYIGPHANHDLVQRCWDLNEINERYQSFIDVYSNKYVIDRNKLEKEDMTDGECFVERTKLIHEYRKFLFIDPGLPEELLPKDWLGDHAAALFRDYYQILAQPASRFFEQVFQEGNELDKKASYNVMEHPLMVGETESRRGE